MACYMDLSIGGTPKAITLVRAATNTRDTASLRPSAYSIYMCIYYIYICIYAYAHAGVYMHMIWHMCTYKWHGYQLAVPHCSFSPWKPLVVSYLATSQKSLRILLDDPRFDVHLLSLLYRHGCLEEQPSWPWNFWAMGMSLPSKCDLESEDLLSSDGREREVEAILEIPTISSREEERSIWRW